MFVLVKDGQRFALLPGKKFYTVGRLSTDLILKDDLSISRTHVRLHLSQSGTDEELKIEDLGSTYGTFLDGGIAKNKKIEAKVLMPLKVGSSVRFGVTTSVWQVTQLSLVTATSSLTLPQIQELEQSLKPLGGSVVQNWTNQCTYLTMNEASVTLKLLHALLDNTTIVTSAYWRDLLQAAQRIHVTAPDGWPQPKDYQPTNIDVKWRPERTKLFEGKTFVFMNRKHVEMYGRVVQKAGGSCKDLNSGVRKTFLTKKDVIVIQYVPSTQSQATETINSIQEILEQADLRIIQEYEIGMALINCSTKEFCNPAQRLVFDSMPTTESMTSSLAANSSIIVPNTEQVPQGSKDKASVEVVISDSDDDARKSEVKSQPKRLTRNATSSQSQHQVLRKRNQAQFLDSSDDDHEEEPPKQTRKRKNSDNCAISMSLSDEDQNVGKVKKLKSNNILLVDSSDDDEDGEKKKSVFIPQKTLKTKAKEPALEENLVKKRKIATTVARRSPHSLKMTTKQPEKQLILTAAEEPLESHSDEENLFQFKTTKTTVKPVEEPPVAAPRISVRNFLEKSQNRQIVVESDRPQTESRKRLRLELLNESDSGNEENLFDFGDNKKKQKRSISNNNQASNASEEDSHDDGLFNFQSAARSDQRDDQDSICTEPFVPNAKEELKKSKYVVPQPQQKSRLVNVSGWLSCGGPHNKLKSEPNESLSTHPTDASLQVKHEIELDIKQEEDGGNDVATIKWLASIKDNIQVQMCSLSISSRSHDAVDATANNENFATVDNYHGRKNFKKFVRKTNRHPHQRILEMKRLQLADGMVASI